MASSTMSALFCVDSINDDMKENCPPPSRGYRKQSKRRVMSSSDDESDTGNSKETKLSKLGSDEALANGDFAPDHSSVSSQSQGNKNETRTDVEETLKASQRKRRRTAVVESDSDDSNCERTELAVDSTKFSSQHMCSDKSGSDKSGSDLSSATRESSSSSSKSRKRKKKRPIVKSDTDSDDDIPVTSRNKPLPSRTEKKLVDGETTLKSTLDPDLFDAETSSDEHERSNNSNEDSEEETSNRLSSKYSGPASKKASKPAKRASKQDDKLKIYSEKQRMIREQAVTVPVYQPPKRSLQEFLSEQAPQLLKALKHRSLSDQSSSAPKHRQTIKPRRPPKYLEQMDYLNECPLLHTPSKPSRARANLSAAVEKPRESLTDNAAECTQGISNHSDDDLPDLLSELSESTNGGQNCSIDKASGLSNDFCDLKPPSSLSHSIRAANSQLNRLDSEGNSQHTAHSFDNSQSNVSVTMHSCSYSLKADNSESNAMEGDSEISRDNSQRSRISGDYSQISGSDIGGSTITVITKTSPMKRLVEAKKLKLRQLLGDTVDLDMVPQLTCEPDGLVVLDGKHTAEKEHFTKFRSSFEKKAAKAREQEEERKLQQEKTALRVVKNLPDGSRHELSMDAYSNKTAEETGGVHKLAVLKQILKAKLSERRNEELQRKEETIKLEALEELPEEEILDDEFSDEEGADNSDADDVGPILHNSDTEANFQCEFEKDEALMKRVRAVLDSDDEQQDESMTSIKPSLQEVSCNRIQDSYMLASLDSMLEGKVPTTRDSTNSQTTQGETVQGAVSEATQGETRRRSVNLMDENAQDVEFPFSPAKPTGTGKAPLGFTQDMFSTQQAEDELQGLCSGHFGTPSSPNRNLTLSAPKDVKESEAITKISAKKKEALHFSDEESETEQPPEDNVAAIEDNVAAIEDNVAAIEDNVAEIDEEEDELDELADESGEELISDNEADIRNEDVNGGEDNRNTTAKTLFLQKPRQTKREKILSEYIEQEAELSGDEAGSDEDLDLTADADFYELEKGEFEHVGDAEKLRSQIAKAHFKQRNDDDARELMLMKEMLLPDGDMHSDSKRQRKFRWRNVEYGTGTQANSHRGRESGDSDMSGSEVELDSDVKVLHEKLEKGRTEREAWLKDQRDMRVQQIVDESQSQPDGNNASGGQTIVTQQQQQGFNFNLGKNKKKSSYILGKSKKYLERFKELHKNIKENHSGPVSHKNLLFRPISKEDAESQQDMIWKV